MAAVPRDVSRDPRSWLTLAVSAALGALVWALSPWLAGHQEPWDAEGFFYVVSLAIAGALAGALAPRPLWAHYLGAFVGQLAYAAIFLPVGPLLLLGVAYLLAFSLVFLLAAAVTGFLRIRVRARA